MYSGGERGVTIETLIPRNTVFTFMKLIGKVEGKAFSDIPNSKIYLIKPMS